MRIRTIDSQKMATIYQSFLTDVFPPAELRSLTSMRSLLQQHRYETFEAVDGNRVIGYAFVYYAFDLDLALLDYYAILPEYRSKGWGSAFLVKLMEIVGKRVSRMLIECEHPDFIEDRTTAERRISFYMANGAVFLPQNVSVYGVAYRLLVMACVKSTHRPVSTEQIEALYQGLLGRVLFDQEFHKIG